MTTCSEPGCDRPAKYRGLCSGCYQRWARVNKPGQKRPIRHASLVEPFGGLRSFCRAVGVETMTVYRWPDGDVPKERHAAIVDAAIRSGVNVLAVMRALGVA